MGGGVPPLQLGVDGVASTGVVLVLREFEKKMCSGKAAYDAHTSTPAHIIAYIARVAACVASMQDARLRMSAPLAAPGAPTPAEGCRLTSMATVVWPLVLSFLDVPAAVNVLALTNARLSRRLLRRMGLSHVVCCVRPRYHLPSTPAGWKLLGSARTVNLRGHNGVVDVPALAKVHTLDLSYCPQIVDVSTLAGVHTLNLRGCARVMDVTALANVRWLNLSRCRGVTDVSCLGGVHTLNLADCSGISDVRSLGSVHTLDLSQCVRVSDVSRLGSVHTLCLQGCVLVVDVRALGSVTSLDLSFCLYLNDVSTLAKVHTLRLVGCSRIVDVSMLGAVHTLDLTFCHRVNDVSMLGCVPKLTLCGHEDIDVTAALAWLLTRATNGPAP